MHLVTQGAVTLKVYQVNRGERTIFSVSDREHGRRQLRQFGRLEKALGWAATKWDLRGAFEIREAHDLEIKIYRKTLHLPKTEKLSSKKLLTSTSETGRWRRRRI